MKNTAVIILTLMLIALGLGSVDTKGAQKESKVITDPEVIKEYVLENCGLDETWTAYMAVYGYVYGDYMYFYKSASSSMDIYRISLNDLKLEKYKKDVYTPSFIDNYVFYNLASNQRLYAKNLDTGKKTLITKHGWSSNVRKYKDYIYFVDRSRDKYRLYVIKADGSGKKLIASGVCYGSEEQDTMVTVYEDKLYFMKYYNSKEGWIAGTKVYSCNPDGSDRKVVKKLKGFSEVTLLVRNMDLLIAYHDRSQKSENKPYGYNMLYRLNGEKFVKLGLVDDYPQYDKRQSDGYSYRVDKLKYDIGILESGRGLKIDREDVNGEWETFGEYPYGHGTGLHDFQIQNGYLLAFGDDGEEPDRVCVFDKDGIFLVDQYIAGYTDECWMHAAVVGDFVYIIHDNYKNATVNGKWTSLDKCQRIDLKEARDIIIKNGDVLLGDIQAKICEMMKIEGSDIAPGSDEYTELIRNIEKEMADRDDISENDKFLVHTYIKAYNNLLRDYIWVNRALSGDWDLEDLDVEKLIERNGCISYDEKSHLYLFNPEERLKQIKVFDVYNITK